MQDRDTPMPERPRAATEIEREERLARALRENLRRRKAQGRARAAQEAVQEGDREVPQEAAGTAGKAAGGPQPPRATDPLANDSKG